MPKSRSLVTAYLLDGEGGGKKLGWEGVESWEPKQGILWVHLDFTAQRSAQWLHKSSGLDKIVVRSMLVEESRPRAVLSNSGLLLFLRGVNLNPGQDPEDMVSIRLWIDQHRIITTRRRQLLSVVDIEKAIQSGVGPQNSVEFLRALNDRLIDRMSDVCEAIDDQVDSLEEKVISEESYLLRPQIADTRREAIMLRRYLAPQRDALNKLHLENSSILSELDRSYIREATDRIVRCIEDLDSARERAAVTQEELSSRLSEQMDRRMYLLSIVAVIFLPLSFITGLLGINVGGIPGASYKWAFLIVCGGLSAIVAGLFYFLRRQKWV